MMNRSRNSSAHNDLFDDLGNTTGGGGDDLSFFNSNFESVAMPPIHTTDAAPQPPYSTMYTNNSATSFSPQPPSNQYMDGGNHMSNSSGGGGGFWSNANLFGGGGGANNSGGNQFFNPNALATDIVFGMGMDQMNKMQQSTASRYWAFFENMKVYFNVNNTYVLYKLLSILFPFVRRWSSSSSSSNSSGGSGVEDATDPNFVRDLKQPDLYIPCMFFITYILLVCGLMGTKNQFTPELLTSIASTGFIISLIEIAIVKLGFYLLSAPSSVSMLDMTAFSGYKYVGVVLTIVSSALIGYWAYLPVCIVSSLMMSLFLIKTLRRVCVTQGEYNMRLQLDSMSSQRSIFIISVALLQIPIFLLLTYRYSRDEYSLLSWIMQLGSTNKNLPPSFTNKP